jgi:thymidylate kinase
MGIVPVDDWNLLAGNSSNGMAASEQPMLPEGIKECRNQFWRLQAQDSDHLQRIALQSRVLIVEGISGSGKDTFQTYLKKKLSDRDVYDYSEGELLQSWNQLQIQGIFELRIKFMNLFINYVRDIVSRDEKALFLLNRFHLSAYVMTIVQQPKLEKEYEKIINVLKNLPVHVFILQVEASEIEKRSLHPERAGAWAKFQQQIVKREGFRDRLQRYVWQQRLMLQTAERQQIPYSIIKSAAAIEGKCFYIGQP